MPLANTLTLIQGIKEPSTKRDGRWLIGLGIRRSALRSGACPGDLCQLVLTSHGWLPLVAVTNNVLRTSLPERGYVSTGYEFSREMVPEGAEQDVFQKVRGIRKRSNSLPDLLVFITLVTFNR